MSYMEYPEALKTGSKLMDQEHEVLASCINLLEDAIKEGCPKKTIEEVLGGLIQYATTQFFVEEELMRTYNFPDYNNHKDAHKAFIQKVRSLTQHIERGDQSVEDRLLDFLKSWMVEHTLQIDAKLAYFLKEHGIP